MKKIVSIIVMSILLLASTTLSADKWSKEDITLASTFTLATIIDWGQSRDIVKNNKDVCVTQADGSRLCNIAYYEKANIFLGKNPSMGNIDTYMPLAILSSLTIAHLLSEDWRTKFLYGLTFLELGTIYNNHTIGLKINF